MYTKLIITAAAAALFIGVAVGSAADQQRQRNRDCSNAQNKEYCDGAQIQKRDRDCVNKTDAAATQDKVQKKDQKRDRKRDGSCQAVSQ